MKTVRAWLPLLFGLAIVFALAAPQCPPGKCQDNGDCRASQLCAKAAGACESDGTCKGRPNECPGVYDPVCGCDGVTYGNECEAHRVGVNVAATGECAATGCRTNAECGPDVRYCAKADGDCDGAGACADRPVQCPLIYGPVCGCDGGTYDNGCFAAAAGTNVAYGGPCIPGACDPSQCTGPRPMMPNWQCPDGSMGGPACLPDAAGVCNWQIRECPS